MSQTGFRDRVYAIVQRIPAGSVLTYAEVARLAGSPNAARAVGQAMKRNQHSFLTDRSPKAIPCHRVVATGYKLGGFNAGERAKTQMLEQEGWSLTSDGTLTKISPNPRLNDQVGQASLRKRGTPVLPPLGKGGLRGISIAEGIHA